MRKLKLEFMTESGEVLEVLFMLIIVDMCPRWCSSITTTSTSTSLMRKEDCSTRSTCGPVSRRRSGTQPLLLFLLLFLLELLLLLLLVKVMLPLVRTRAPASVILKRLRRKGMSDVRGLFPSLIQVNTKKNYLQSIILDISR